MSIKTIRLDARVEKRKHMSGRLLEVKATLGNIDGSAKDEGAAIASLRAKVESYCSEDSTPFVMLDPDGHAWVAYRCNDGDWVYTHYRPMAGYKGAMQSGSTFLAKPTRANTVAAMIAHFEQLHGGIAP